MVFGRLHLAQHSVQRVSSRLPVHLPSLQKVQVLVYSPPKKAKSGQETKGEVGERIIEALRH